MPARNATAIAIILTIISGNLALGVAAGTLSVWLATQYKNSSLGKDRYATQNEKVCGCY